LQRLLHEKRQEEKKKQEHKEAGTLLLVWSELAEAAEPVVSMTTTHRMTTRIDIAMVFDNEQKQ
jgi:hypothetical protein